MMTKPITLQILEWNRKRNMLEFNLDLEVSMLTEEANEFFFANTLVDRIDAYCDFKYVVAGTSLKFYAQKVESCDELFKAEQQWSKIASWAESVSEQMHNIILSELTSMPTYLSQDRIWNILQRSFKVVAEANDKKGKVRREDGKVLKGSDWTPPEPVIAQILKENGVEVSG